MADEEYGYLVISKNALRVLNEHFVRISFSFCIDHQQQLHELILSVIPRFIQIYRRKRLHAWNQTKNTL